MPKQELLPNHYVRPGHIFLPDHAIRLGAVVGSGVVLTVYDRRLQRGGLGYYTHPVRKGRLSSPVFAAPSIVRLIELFRDGGAREVDLEAHLYGGAVNAACSRYEAGLSEANVRTGLQLLQKLRVGVVGQDVGGSRGRKIIFHTGTGETLVAKVESVRGTDWYPPWDPDELARLEARNHA